MGSGIPLTLILPRQARQAMLAHADYCHPNECCGLLAGDPGGLVHFVYPLTNADHSPISYTVDPREHFEALKHAERNGWELIGAFHSHPQGSPRPSATDLARASEPDWVYVIVSERALEAFRIVDRAATLVALLPG